MLVNIQLFEMPGDERKFKRRLMVAFMPACSCGGSREHASASDGFSTIGVGDVSGVGDPFDGSVVGVCAGASAGTGVFVATIGVEISVDSKVVGIPVGGGEGVWAEGRGVDVETNETDSCVPLEPLQFK